MASRRVPKRINRRKALGYIRAISSDPDFVAGAKEVLARKPKPFDYESRRNDKPQLRYENGRLFAIRILQSSLCFLVMLALWAVRALAQQKWWRLQRSNYVDPNSILDTCEGNPRPSSPADWYEGANAAGDSAKIVDAGGGEVDVYTVRHGGGLFKTAYFRTQEACQKAAQANIDTANAEKAKVDKYR
jgi:hypothetical protein